MIQVRVNMTQDELHERLNLIREQGVSVSDHLRIALGMRPLGDPPCSRASLARVCGSCMTAHARSHAERLVAGFRAAAGRLSARQRLEAIQFPPAHAKQSSVSPVLTVSRAARDD
jgi:hypothetical protein